MNVSNSNVIVTGADGFTGHHLCRHLVNRGAKVRALVKPGLLKNLKRGDDMEIVVGDVTDYQSILNAMKGIDAAFHLAAITSIPETRAVIGNTFSVNSSGTLNVLMAARERGVAKVLYTSTCHVYGKQESMPIKEISVPMPIDIYSASKLAGEHLCTAFVEMFGLDITISRAFNHFGPGQREEFLIPSVIRKLLRNQPIRLGNPEPTRDFTYVEDVVAGYVTLAEKGRRGETYHLCSGEERTVREIVEKILEVAESKAKVSWDPEARKIDLPRSVGSYEKARKEFGWEPKVSFEEGLQRTVDWYTSSSRGVG